MIVVTRWPLTRNHYIPTLHLIMAKWRKSAADKHKDAGQRMQTARRWPDYNITTRTVMRLCIRGLYMYVYVYVYRFLVQDSRRSIIEHSFTSSQMGTTV